MLNQGELSRDLQLGAIYKIVHENSSLAVYSSEKCIMFRPVSHRNKKLGFQSIGHGKSTCC